MWRSTKQFLIVASVALNLAFVGVWVAQVVAVAIGKEVPSLPTTPGRIWCPLHEKLNVSDEQWVQIEPRLKQFRQSAQSVCQQMSKLRMEMLELVAAPAADRAAIAAKQEEIQAGQRKMQGLVIDHLLAEKEVLTPEQQERLFALIREQSGCDRDGAMMMPGPSQRGIGRVLREGSPSQ